MSNQSCLGLIAGDGTLPFEIARAARSSGRRVCAIGYPGVTHPDLEKAVDSMVWLRLGEFAALMHAFAREGVREAVMAGKVTKQHLYADDLVALRPDARALALIARVADLRDDTILDAIAQALGEEGVTLLPQIQFCPDLTAHPGVLGQVELTPAQRSDIAFGWPIAKAVASLDLGQSLIVESRAVLAVEAIEGTDAAILRGGRLGRGGACLIKVAKPRQDPRFDLPTIGPGTLRAMLEARVAVLAFEAHCTIILDREELLGLADANEIPVVAIDSEGPVRPRLETRAEAE